MKRYLLTVLLPLILIQQPTFAQTSLDGEAASSPTAQQLQTDVQTTSINTQPALTPLEGTEQVQLHLVNCSWWLDCALARLLLPASAYIDQWELQFDNATTNPVNLINTTIVAQGRLTGYQLSNSAKNPAISISKPSEPLPAQQIVSLPLALNRSAMPPDQYNGKIYLTLAEPGNRLILPLDLSVRSGPFIPLLVLFVGIILGRLFKYMQERGEPQSKVLKEVNRLTVDIERVHPDDQKILTSMVADVRKLVFREQLEEATTKLATIRNRLDILAKLRILQSKMEQRVEPLEDKLVNDALHEIDNARDSIVLENDEQAKTSLDKVLTILGNVGSRSAGTSEMTEMARGVLVDLDRVPQQSALVTATPTGTERLQMFLITLSGISDQVRAETTFWIVRPLLSLLLLIGLSIVGINSLYVENGLTFGARPLSDYMGLILWGLSADVASRSLSSLQGGKE